MVPQSPSPTLLSHSFRLSLRLIIAVALASIAASRIHPCLLSSWDGAKICRRITNHDNWGTANAYASVIKDKKMQNSLESSVKRDNDNRAHGFPILWIWHWETETKQYHITAWKKNYTHNPYRTSKQLLALLARFHIRSQVNWRPQKTDRKNPNREFVLPRHP